MHLRLPILLLLSALMVPMGAAQNLAPRAALGPYDRTPSQYEILGVSVEGIESETAQTVISQASGLQVGQTITLPGDEALAEAIRSIYRLGLFSDVKILEERTVGNGVFLAIRVIEEPRLMEYTFSGVKRGHRNDLKEEVPLLTGAPVRPSDIERTKQEIIRYFHDKGYMMTEVAVVRESTPEGHVKLDFVINRGPKVEVSDIVIRGNEAVSDFRIKRQMKETNEDRWWRFWSSSTFDREEYEDDLQNIVRYYNDKGFYDARIVEDTVVVRNGDDPGVVVELRVEEGSRYHIRNIDWEGNTVYPDDFLTGALGFREGDAFDRTKLEQNLYANRNSSDVSSLYMNRGYMRFQVEPSITVVGDSLDLHFEVMEGDVYEFGDVDIAGNTKTKEHVIRRELYTVPGQTFSRDAIQESIRRLSQLNYFTQESLGGGPSIDIDEQEKEVDLSYTVAEQGSDQLELSGTWGSFGLVLMLRFSFNNFSAQNLFNTDAWNPLPAGDGQKLSVALQTSGTLYQNYSLSFTEPWFRGRPTPIGFALSYSNFRSGIGRRSVFARPLDESSSLQTGSARAFYERRLKWPDDKFTMSTGVRYQYYHNDSLFTSIPQGVSQLATLQQSLSRNSLDHPIFPMRGSEATLSLEIAPPIGNFVQYHKWRFKSQWHVPIVGKLGLGFSTDFGFVGSLTGDPVDFERFIVGGSPFDTQGFTSYFGRDVVYMRGYPAAAIGPRRGGEPVGGTILNRYTSELKLLAIQTQQLSAAPYLFLDAANTWNGFNSYNPSELYRSGGVGMRLFLPILGMLELTYGYNFDEFESISGRHDGSNQWYFQFSLGQGFGN